MLRLSGSKHRLHVLIAFLIGSVLLISGCAGRGTVQEQEVFYPEFYAAKKLDNADIVKLRQLASSINPYVSSAATLLLGNYYLKYGDKSYGKLLINKSWNAKEYGKQMQLFGKLWKMDAYVYDRDIPNARELAIDIKNMQQDEVYLRTLKIYCTTAGLPSDGVRELSICLDTRLSGSKAPTSADMADVALKDAAPSDNLTYEEFVKLMGDGGETLVVESAVEQNITIKPDETINIVGGDINDDEMMGMMYAISRLRCSFKMNNISENAAADMGTSDVIVRTNNMQIQVGDINTTIGVDWNELIETAGRMTYAGRFDVVMIAASESKMLLAKLLQVLYKDRGIESIVSSFNHPAFQANLRSSISKHTDKKILLIGIGAEEELQTFAGVAKFLQTNVEKEKILLITSSIGDVKLRPEFSAYYRDILVLTPIQTVDDVTLKNISTDFSTYFGKPINARGMQGYDAVVYLKNMTSEAPDEKFISNISEIYNEKAVRSIRLFTFNKQLAFKELELELIELALPDELNNENQNQTEVQQ